MKLLFHRSRCILLVGMTRLELATTRPPDVYANQLRYIPNCRAKVYKNNDTRNSLLRAEF